MEATIFVLTGGPCAGKSTLLGEIARRGFPVIAEAAREVIQEGRLTPSRHPLEFQREVLRRQLRAEREAPPGAVFADRGVGDHFGYLEHYRARRAVDLLSEFSQELAAAWEEARKRYGAVFLLAQNPRFSRESYRVESAAEAAAIHDALAGAYRTRHPRVIEVAWGPIEERLERILEAAGLHPTDGGPLPPGGRRS